MSRSALSAGVYDLGPCCKGGDSSEPVAADATIAGAAGSPLPRSRCPRCRRILHYDIFASFDLVPAQGPDGVIASAGPHPDEAVRSALAAIEYRDRTESMDASAYASRAAGTLRGEGKVCGPDDSVAALIAEHGVQAAADEALWNLRAAIEERFGADTPIVGRHGERTAHIASILVADRLLPNADSPGTAEGGPVGSAEVAAGYFTPNRGPSRPSQWTEAVALLAVLDADGSWLIESQ